MVRINVGRKAGSPLRSIYKYLLHYIFLKIKQYERYFTKICFYIKADCFLSPISPKAYKVLKYNEISWGVKMGRKPLSAPQSRLYAPNQNGTSEKSLSPSLSVIVFRLYQTKWFALLLSFMRLPSIGVRPMPERICFYIKADCFLSPISPKAYKVLKYNEISWGVKMGRKPLSAPQSRLYAPNQNGTSEKSLSPSWYSRTSFLASLSVIVFRLYQT